MIWFLVIMGLVLGALFYAHARLECYIDELVKRHDDD